MAKQTQKRQGNRNQLRLHFDSPEVDFNLQFILGYGAADGAAIGEALYAASQINERDLTTWAPAWLDMAARVEDKACAAAAAGHAVSAREAYLRASTYYRTALFGLGVDDPRLKATGHKLRRCFAEAAQRFDPPFEPVEIPFEDKKLPGYFLRPSADGKPRSTLIMIGGGETYNEELYFWTGEAGLKRGWNVLTVDLPGQGWTVHQGMTYRHDTESPFSSIVEYLVSRDDVDPKRIVSYGISLGGYLVLRAAAYEKRLAAIALSTPMFDVHKWAVDGLPIPVDKLPDFMVDMAAKLAGYFEPASQIALEKWLSAVAGCNKVSVALERLEAWTVDVSLVTCPTFCIVGAGEAQTFLTQTQETYEALSGPKDLRTTTLEEGADGHCQANNLPLSQSVVFDWFEEVLT
ncbi:MAG: alpha/beta fold hydrolase [Ardenticatenaceae bacterium]|nr:alpha/beta fold hydrolase [Ardenticatenaceae bacterium]